jgi:hypothetical protein
MDQALLVKSDRDTGAKVIAALHQAAIPVTLFDWNYIPELQEWQLIIASPWVDTKGPHTANRALVDALKQAGVYDDVPIRRVFLRSPNDPIVKSIQRELTEQNQGFLHLLKDQSSNPVAYSLIFAPTTSPGGAAPMKIFRSLPNLTTFLTESLGLRQKAVSDALDEVERTDVASLYPVTLTTRQIKRFGLV